MTHAVTLCAAILITGLLRPSLSVQAQISDRWTRTELAAQSLVNLFKNVRWPTREQPANLCFLERSPVVDLLRKGLERNENWTRLTGRSLEVRVISDTSDLTECRILYIDASAADRLWKTFTVPKGILTVSDQKEFLSNNGMMRFQWAANDDLSITMNRELVLAEGFAVSGPLAILARAQ